MILLTRIVLLAVGLFLDGRVVLQLGSSRAERRQRVEIGMRHRQDEAQMPVAEPPDIGALDQGKEEVSGQDKVGVAHTAARRQC